MPRVALALVAELKLTDHLTAPSAMTNSSPEKLAVDALLALNDNTCVALVSASSWASYSLSVLLVLLMTAQVMPTHKMSFGTCGF